MKNIVFATRWKRVVGRLIDFLILAIFSCATFFGLIYPNTFDKTSYTNNLDTLGEYYRESGLFLESSSGSFVSLSSFSEINTVEELTSVDITYSDKTYKALNITDSLYRFYNEKYFGFSGNSNLTLDVFKSTILKVGSDDSNIKDFSYENNAYKYVLIDSTDGLKTVNFFVSAFDNAVSVVANSSKVNNISEKNRQIMLSSIKYFIPVVIGFSFIFDLLIPLCFKNGESIGKYIFGFSLLDKNGYRLKKYWLIPRWIGYILVEVILGVLTVGGTVLISYTMLVFNKKHRVIHDYFGNSICINKKESLWFDSVNEENYIKSKSGGFYNG